MIEIKNVILTDEFGETHLEIWRSGDSAGGHFVAQAILARGIVGRGSTEARAIQNLREKLAN